MTQEKAQPLPADVVETVALAIMRYLMKLRSITDEQLVKDEAYKGQMSYMGIDIREVARAAISALPQRPVDVEAGAQAITSTLAAAGFPVPHKSDVARAAAACAEAWGLSPAPPPASRGPGHEMLLRNPQQSPREATAQAANAVRLQSCVRLSAEPEVENGAQDSPGIVARDRCAWD